MSNATRERTWRCHDRLRALGLTIPAEVQIGRIAIELVPPAIASIWLAASVAPAGLSLLFLLATLVCTWLRNRGVVLTQEGERVLAELRGDYEARVATRQHGTTELVTLGVALFGLEALSGTSFADLFVPLSPSASTRGCGGGGCGGGGDGSGGCGGGCGGCGGG